MGGEPVRPVKKFWDPGGDRDGEVKDWVEEVENDEVVRRLNDKGVDAGG